METKLKEEIKQTKAGMKADEILRKCVHCGFCLATCPTYQIQGDELDSPRGRIYLIKSMLEGNVDTGTVHQHLDRCLTCRGCETTCPSGVEYGRLLEIGREQLVAEGVDISLFQKLYRWSIRKTLTSRKLLRLALFSARLTKPFLPQGLTKKIPEDKKERTKSQAESHQRKIILFQGCAQPELTPATNQATEALLDSLGVSAIYVENERCCGALSHHLSASEEAKLFVKKNIDSWWPHIESGVESIINTASGCGVMLKDYEYLMQDEEEYAEKAKKVSALCQDISEYLNEYHQEKLQLKAGFQDKKICYHSPCTMQHGQKLNGIVESLISARGVELTEFPESNMCCGSAGAYSLLQPELSKQLQTKKITAIESVDPDIIITSNIGCQLHLQEGGETPVKHWIELFEVTH